jgi:radical SAM superfamily enzyme YgiQ (UPF0313 family)
MKVLIVSTNKLPASPSGPAYIAGALRAAGHMVEVFENLFTVDIGKDLSNKLAECKPDVVGVSIRLVFGDVLDSNSPWGTKYIDLRPNVKAIIDVIKANTNAFIVLGGPGFSYYEKDWLNYLNLNYGICGEGEESFRLLLELLSEKKDISSVPGCVFRENGSFHKVAIKRIDNLNTTALPAYDLFEMERYAELKITPAIFTKRGCAFSCSFCPYSKLDGKRYRLKTSERVLDEIRATLDRTPGRRIMFCDNSFNAPKLHAEELCKTFIDAGVDFNWGSGDLKPIGITDDFCKLMEDSGCFYVNLAIESASETMLAKMKRGYKVHQVRESLDVLSRSNIPFGISLMFGSPGETPETIAETLKVVEDYNIPDGAWVTVGVYLWTEYQDIVAEMKKTGQLQSNDLFSGVVYISPNLSKNFLEELITTLRAKPEYSVQCNKPMSWVWNS